MDVTLTSTYRDADARLLYMFEYCISKLRQLYRGINVVVSPLTHESARRRLTEFGVDVYSSPENGRVFAKGYKIDFARVRGLEWETPDRFRKEIEVEGYRRWLRGFETPAEWRREVRVADEIVAGALNAARKLIKR